MQTIPELADLSKHPFARMLDERLSITFCTDNRLVSHTMVTDEIEKALQHFDIPNYKLRDMIIYGFKRSFFFGDYPEKRKYMRNVIDVYDRLQKEFAIN